MTELGIKMGDVVVFASGFFGNGVGVVSGFRTGSDTGNVLVEIGPRGRDAVVNVKDVRLASEGLRDVFARKRRMQEEHAVALEKLSDKCLELMREEVARKIGEPEEFRF